MRESIPRGMYPYPRTFRKGQIPAKTSYFVSQGKHPERDEEGHPIVPPEYAELLIASVPEELDTSQKREYWERSVLVAYYHLYGEYWSQWEAIIPWLDQTLIPLKADKYACEMPWDWSAKSRFLNQNGFRWSLSDLNRLIDRYPDYQQDNSSQGMYIPGKSFEEIQQVAVALNLPTVKTLMLLAEYAHELN